MIDFYMPKHRAADRVVDSFSRARPPYRGGPGKRRRRVADIVLVNIPCPRCFSRVVGRVMSDAGVVWLTCGTCCNGVRFEVKR